MSNADTVKTPPNKKTILTALGVGIIASIAVVTIILYMFQGFILYGKPTSYQAPTAGWEAVKINVANEGAMTAYHFKAKEGKPTVLFLHGRGYGYEGSMKVLQAFTKDGMGALIAEYPGYGGNPGKFSAASSKAMAVNSFKWLTDNGIKQTDIVVYGEGFGAGPAIAAAQKPNKRLLIVSGFSDMTRMVQARYPFIPDFFVKDEWNTVDELKKVPTRVIIVHAPDNIVTPVEQGRELAAASKTSTIEIPGGHAIAFDEGLQSSLAVALLR